MASRKEHGLGHRACSHQIVCVLSGQIILVATDLFAWFQFSVSDLNLDENEVLKFVSLSNGANNKDTIDVLRKSPVIRNW